MSKQKTSFKETLLKRNPDAMKQEQQRVIVTPVDVLDPKGQKPRTDEQMNPRTPEQAHKRTDERMNKRTPEREIKRQSFDIFLDQYFTLLDIRTERKKKLKRDVTLGELAQEAFEMFISFERTSAQAHK
jgi:hypothetical protein